MSEKTEEKCENLAETEIEKCDAEIALKLAELHDMENQRLKSPSTIPSTTPSKVRNCLKSFWRLKNWRNFFHSLRPFSLCLSTPQQSHLSHRKSKKFIQRSSLVHRSFQWTEKSGIPSLTVAFFQSFPARFSHHKLKSSPSCKLLSLSPRRASSLKTTSSLDM